MTRNRLWGIVAVIVGVAMWAGTFGIIVFDLRTSTTWRSPGTTSVYLKPGKWVIAEKMPIDTNNSSTGEDALGKRTISADQVSVSGPTGSDPGTAAKLPVTCVYCGGSELRLPLDLKIYAGIGGFTVSEAGNYQITSTGGAAELAVSDPVQSVQSGTVWWLSTFVIGLFLVIFGIFQIARRPQTGEIISERVAPVEIAKGPSGASPSGWYPDPYGPEFERWWDGKKWTDHRR